MQRDQHLIEQIESRVDEARRIAQAVESNGGQYSDEDRTTISRLFNEAKSYNDDLELYRADQELFGQLQSFGASLGMDRGLGLPAPGAHTHSWAAEITRYTSTLLGQGGRKDFLTPAGSVVVALPAPPVVSQTQPIRRMRQLVTVEDAPGGHYRYLEQTVRDWAAAEVERGAEKPVSSFGLTLREGQAPVVATVSEPLDRFLLSDAPALNQFVGTELQAAVEHAIEAAAIGELADANLEAVDFGVDALTTLRRAIGALEELGVTASAAILNPADWEAVETTRVEPGGATGAWMLDPGAGGGAPLDMTARRAWGVPILTTTACPAGTAYVGDFVTYARFYGAERGAVRLDWSEAMGFRTNEITFRCECRIKLALQLKPAFVTVSLAEAVGGGGGGASGGENGGGVQPASGTTKKAAS